MSTGKLDEAGLQNITAITQLVEEQQIIYDFKYQKQEMPTNVSVLVVGEGRTLFKNTLHMPVQRDQKKEVPYSEVKEKVEQVIKDQETVDEMRKAILVFGHHFEKAASEFTIPEEVSTFAQDKFVQVRQKENEQNSKVETDDDRFHRWLTLARYMSLSRGELSLTVETFEKAVVLESARVSRCPKVVEKQAASGTGVKVSDECEEKENIK